jgi:hypothetical protein
VFFNLGPSFTLSPTPALRQADDALVVEWSRLNSLKTPLSSNLNLQPHDWHEQHVTLAASPGLDLLVRFRLPLHPCLLELRRIEIRGRDRQQVLWSVDPAQLGAVVSCAGNLLESPTAHGLSIIHFGGESFVSLPAVRLNASEDTGELSIWLRYVPSLLDFSRKLRQAFIDGDLPDFVTDGHALPRLGEVRAPREVAAQLYIPDHGEDLEARSTRLVLRGANEWVDLAYDVPPLPIGAVLRFDPADQPGLLEIANLTLEPLESSAVFPGQHASHARTRSWLGQLACEEDAILLSNDESVRVLSFGSDSILKLAPLTADVANRKCRLRVSLRFTDVVPSDIWARALQDCRSLATNPVLRLENSHSLPASTTESLPMAEAIPPRPWRYALTAAVWLTLGITIASAIYYGITSHN